MGSPRALAVLAALAAVLVAVVALDLRRPRQPARASQRLLPGCGAVQRLVWHRPGQPPVILARQPDGALALDGVRGPVDGDVLADVLGTLEILSYRRALPADRAARGLDQPRLRLAVTCEDGRETRLALGHRIEQIDRVWLARTGAHAGARAGAHAGDRTGAPAGALDYLVDGHAARALDRDRDALRSRRVFVLAGGMPGASRDSLAAAGIERIELRQGADARVLSGDPPMVWLDAPAGGRARADAALVAALTARVRELAIERFVDAVPEARADALAAGAGLHLRVHTRAPAGARAEPDPGPVVQELIELGPCPDGPGLRLLSTTVGTGCVDAGALAAVAAFAGASLVSRHLLDPAARIARIHIVPAGAPAVTLVARGSAWVMHTEQGRPPGEAPGIARDTDAHQRGRPAPWSRPGEAPGMARDTDAAHPGEPAEARAVHEWLASLARTTGRGIVRAGDTVPGPRVLALTFTHADGRTEQLDLFRSRDGGRTGWLARRDQEPLYLTLAPGTPDARRGPEAPALDDDFVRGLRALAGPAGWQRFRRRQLLALEPYALREVVASPGRGSPGVVHLVRGALLDDWHVQAPAGASLRPGAIDAIREAAARLRARRFLDDTPGAAHGLRTPRRRVEVVFDPGPLDLDDTPRRHRIDLGAPTPAGCAARLDDQPGVFELDRAWCDALMGPWIE